MTMQVRILQPSKSATQSGRGKSTAWVIQPVLVTARTPEPLMGWVSAGDTFSELQNKLKFATAEAAIEFATQQGWVFEVEEPEQRKIKPRNYLDNFRTVRPQDEEKLATLPQK
jgi:hypothetical protein